MFSSAVTREKIRNSSARFLFRAFSIFSLLLAAVKRPRVLVYSIDKAQGRLRIDSRAEQIYSSLDELDLSYFELIHLSSLRGGLINLFRRRRVVCYFEFVSQFWITNLLSLSSVKKLVSIDDFRHTSALITAARKAGQESIAVQHGCFFSEQLFPAGKETICFDKVVVWSQFFADRLSEFLPHQQTEIISHPRSRIKFPERGRDDRTVLLIQEQWQDLALTESYFTQLSLIKGIKLKLRVRPGSDLRYYRKFFSDRELVASEDIFDDLASTSVVVGSYSSALYQALLVGAGVVVLQGERFAEDLVSKQCATFVADETEVCAAIEKELLISSETRLERRAKIWGRGTEGRSLAEVIGEGGRE